MDRYYNGRSDRNQLLGLIVNKKLVSGLLHFFIIGLLIIFFQPILAAGYSKGVIKGGVVDQSGKPVAGAKVEAYDSDKNADDFIGRAVSDARGNYTIKIPKKTKKKQWDGPKTNRHTQWRPDIYVIATKPEYKRFKSRVFSNHKLANNLIINPKITLTGARTVRGRVTDSAGLPIVGARVTACDSDTGADQRMGMIQTNKNGNYKIKYRGGSWDGPKTNRHTQWRPDIYVVVTKNGFKKYKSRTKSDHRLAQPLNLTIKLQNQSGKKHPSNADMCNFKSNSPAARCKAKGANHIWLGPENKFGRCVPLRNQVHAAQEGMKKTANFLTEFDALVIAYKVYFKTVSAGAAHRNLPKDVVNRLSPYFGKKHLRKISYASSKHTSGEGTAMTDCFNIYFPAGSGAVREIKNGNIFNDGNEFHLNWLIHELQHTRQCEKIGGRNNYALRWFGEVGGTTLGKIYKRQKVSSKQIHDAMPMEKDADRRARNILSKLNSGNQTINQTFQNMAPARSGRSSSQSKSLP